MKTGLRFRGCFKVQCVDPIKGIIWESTFKNTILDAALDSILGVYFHGDSPITTWYVGLINDNPTIIPADTLASHAGWTENSMYTGTRQTFIEAAASGKALSNSSNPAVFTMNNSTVIAGAFLCSVASGNTGLLFSAAVFDEGDATVTSNQIINVIYEIQAADAVE